MIIKRQISDICINRLQIAIKIINFATKSRGMEEAEASSFLFYINDSIKMIDKDKLKATVEEAIAGTGVFLVDIQVRPDNEIVVEVDSQNGVDLDTCADLTRKIEAKFDRDEEDYSLEVGSAGLTAPFKVVEQYTKNLGKEIEVLTKDGRKITGTLTSVDGDTSSFSMDVPTKVKEPGAKRPVVQQVPTQLKMDECKIVKHLFRFK